MQAGDSPWVSLTASAVAGAHGGSTGMASSGVVHSAPMVYSLWAAGGTHTHGRGHGQAPPGAQGMFAAAPTRVHTHMIARELTVWNDIENDDYDAASAVIPASELRTGDASVDMLAYTHAPTTARAQAGAHPQYVAHGPGADGASDIAGGATRSIASFIASPLNTLSESASITPLLPRDDVAAHTHTVTHTHAGGAVAGSSMSGAAEDAQSAPGTTTGLAAAARSRAVLGQAQVGSPSRPRPLAEPLTPSRGDRDTPSKRHTPSRAAAQTLAHTRSRDGAAACGLSPAAATLLATPRPTRRRPPRVPYKVLDAPALPDDFYLHVLDWSAGNALAVGLGKDVYLWSGHTAQVTKLASLDDGETVTSLAWTQRGGHIAIGCVSGRVLLYDASTLTRVRTLGGHSGRCTSLSWAGPTLATGARDRQILIRDVRAPADAEAALVGHKHEVCGLRWSPDWSMLASGGNDNKLMIWSAATFRSSARPAASPLLGRSDPMLVSDCHKAAVKALAWSPHQSGILASGGGTHDRCIRFTNVATGMQISSIDTGAQVTSLIWCPHALELASTHGFSLNCLTVWRYPSMSRIATLTGHNSRVLYSALAPDGESIVTGAGDETLRFWHAFPPRPASPDEDAPTEIAKSLEVSFGSLR